MASDADLDGIEVSFDKQAVSTTLSADEERRLARAAVAAALVAVRQLAAAAAEEPVKNAPTNFAAAMARLAPAAV